MSKKELEEFLYSCILDNKGLTYINICSFYLSELCHLNKIRKYTIKTKVDDNNLNIIYSFTITSTSNKIIKIELSEESIFYYNRQKNIYTIINNNIEDRDI